MYKRNIGAGQKNNIMNTNLHNNGSVSKYSPKPPHIPDSILFDLLL